MGRHSAPAQVFAARPWVQNAMVGVGLLGLALGVAPLVAPSANSSDESPWVYAVSESNRDMQGWILAKYVRQTVYLDGLSAPAR